MGAARRGDGERGRRVYRLPPAQARQLHRLRSGAPHGAQPWFPIGHEGQRMIRKALWPLLFLLPVPVSAGPLSDVLMAPGLFDDAMPGIVAAYGEERSVPPGESVTVKSVSEGKLTLEAVD